MCFVYYIEECIHVFTYNISHTIDIQVFIVCLTYNIRVCIVLSHFFYIIADDRISHTSVYLLFGLS